MIDLPLVFFNLDDSGERLGIQRGEVIVPLETISDPDQVIEFVQVLGNLSKFEERADAAISRSQTVETVSVTEADVRAPLDPTKIVRIEGSYEHDLDNADYNPFIDTEGLRERDWPRFWVAPESALARPPGTLEVPKFAKRVKPGLELAFVIGRNGKYWTEEEAFESVAGCLVMVNLGIYDSLPGQWGYRFFDGAMTFGPGLVPSDRIDLSTLRLSLELNGEELDARSTSAWRFSPGEMVSTVSQIMSLRAGDVITSGDPMRIHHTVENGDTLRGHVSNLGTVEVGIRREETDAEVLI